MTEDLPQQHNLAPARRTVTRRGLRVYLELWLMARTERVSGLASRTPDEVGQEVQPPENTVVPSEHALAASTVAHRWIPRWMLTFGIVMSGVSVAAFAVIDVASPSQRWSMLDLHIYRWAGLVARHSGNLYSSHFPGYHLRFTYPPLAALIFAALSAISMSALTWLVTVASATSLVVALWLTFGMLGYQRSAGRIGATLAVAGLALWLQPVQDTLKFGQVNLILMLIIMADLCRPDGARFKGAGVGLTAGFKLTPLIFIAYLLLTRRFRAASVASAAFVLTIVGSLILLPTQSQRFWFAGLFLDSHRTGNNAYMSNQSLHGSLARLLGSVSAAQPYWLASSIVVGIIGLLLAAMAGQYKQEMIGILTCALTGLLISPVSWSHHWVWVAPALIVAGDMAIRIGASVPQSIQDDQDTGRFASWGLRSGWRPMITWTAIAVLAAPFFTLPEALVPASVVQGTGAHGLQVLIGNLYVITGLIVLCLVGVTFIMPKQRANKLLHLKR